MKNHDKEYWKILGLTGGSHSKKIQEHIIEGIMSGILKPNDIIPSMAALGKHNGGIKPAVRIAYDKLKELGWLTTKEGAHTYVADDFPGYDEIYPSYKVVVKLPVQLDQALNIKTYTPGQSQNFITLGFDTPSPHYFPASLYSNYLKIHRRNYEDLNQSRQMLDLHGLEYKEAVLNYLNSRRKLAVHSENLKVVIGRMESLDAVFGALLSPNDVIINTSDQDLMLKASLSQHNLKANLSLNMADSAFIDKLEVLATEQSIKAIYIRPQCGYPKGDQFPVDSCEKLIALAKKYKFYIIEEEDYHEFWYKLPYKPLIRYDHGGHVIYLGAVSLIANYLLNTRTVIAASDLIERMEQRGIVTSPFRDLLAEKSLTDLINSGKLWDYIKKARLEKKRHRDQAIWIIQNYLSQDITVNNPEVGLSLWLEFQSDKILKDSMEHLDIEYNLPYHPNGEMPAPGIKEIRLGFGTWNLSETEQWAKSLHEKFRKDYNRTF